MNPESAPDLRHDEQPLKGATRAAGTTIGGVMWEVIQPLDDEGIFARFLREKGEGVHHIAVATPDFAGTAAEQRRRGETLPLDGSFGGIEFAFLPTDRTLGVLIETFSGFPSDDDDRQPDAPDQS